MNWAFAGQLVTVLAIVWYVSALFFGWLAERKERREEAFRNLNEMIDRFSHRYGQRSEDRDDQAYEA